jgi:hypothetical protein
MTMRKEVRLTAQARVPQEPDTPVDEVETMAVLNVVPMLDATDLQILDYVYAHGGHLTPDEVAAALDLERERVWRRFSTLQAAGYLAPFCPGSRRYALTYRGGELMATAA